jgi:hypothetical protein
MKTGKPKQIKKTCIYMMNGSLCSHIRLKRASGDVLAKTQVNCRVKCRFKDKNECPWYKKMECVGFRKWLKLSPLEKGKKPL